jgi:hypothetical protein
MTTQNKQREAQDTAASDRWDAEGGASLAPASKQRSQRDQRWAAEKEAHWHRAGYTSETQSRSDAEKDS